MAREELALGMVGGLLISYRLEGGLRGASSTEDEMTSGCEGSVMEPCIGVSLGALRWFEGDEDLTPRVFAMADLEKVIRGACATWAQMGVLWKWCSILAAISHLRKVFAWQMTGLK